MQAQWGKNGVTKELRKNHKRMKAWKKDESVKSGVFVKVEKTL